MGDRRPSKARISSVQDDFDPALGIWAESPQSPTQPAPPERTVPAPDVVPQMSYIASPGFDQFPLSPPFGFSYDEPVYADGFSETPLHSPDLGHGFSSRKSSNAREERPASPRDTRRGSEGSMRYVPPVRTLTEQDITTVPRRVSVGSVPNRSAQHSHMPVVREAEVYTAPPAPPPPEIPDMFEEPITPGPYEPFRGQEVESVHSPIRNSMGRRFSRTIRKTLKGRRSVRYSGAPSVKEGDEEAGNYVELRPMDEKGENVAVDVSGFAFFAEEFSVPHKAAEAMKNENFDDNKAYTEDGKVVDLSSFMGVDTLFEASQRKDSINVFDKMERKPTLSADQSLYFSNKRNIPNWKPVPMRTWYIVLMLLITIGLFVGAEILFQFSDQHKVINGPGLFSYKNIEKLTTSQFAVWKYIPTLIGVVYGILWKVTDEGIKRGEPYHQLSKSGAGALASRSLNIEYHTIWAPFVPITAIRYRQWVVAASGILSTLASAVVPTLLSVFIRAHPDQDERKRLHDEEGIAYEKMTKYLVIDGPFTRALQATLVLIFVLGVYVLWRTHKRRTGLLGDPSGIAGVAAMATSAHVMKDFEGLDTASEEEIHKQLNKRAYILTHGALYGAHMLTEADRNRYQAPKAMNPHPLFLRFKGMVPFIGFCLFLLLIIPFVPKNDTLNNFVDNAPWLIVALSVLLKSLWELVEKDMRMLEPFWILARRHADASVLTLDYTATIPGAVVIKALLNRHYLLAWVCTVSLLVELLTVVMGSLGFDEEGSYGEESETSWQISQGLAISILIILILSQALVLALRRKPFLPRQPGTISSVLGFIYCARMLQDFEMTATMSTVQRREKLQKIGKRYGFGWYKGIDGQAHCGVDEEELIWSYRFGEDPRKAVSGPLVDAGPEGIV